VTEGYIEKTDPGLTVRFPLLDRPGESLLVWTTTPWTLTSNVAAAIGPELTYVQVKQGDDVLWLSRGATGTLKGAFEVLGELPGSALIGWRYAGPFDELPAAQNPGGWAELGLRRLFTHIPAPAVHAHPGDVRAGPSRHRLGGRRRGRGHGHRPHRARLRRRGLRPRQGRELARDRAA